MSFFQLFNVLFLCIGNLVCLILVESVFCKIGDGCFNVFFVGSYFKGEVYLLVIEMLCQVDYLVEGLCFKVWDEFVVLDVLVMDFVFIVCDQVVGEVCLLWLGELIIVYWGIEDLS